MNYLHTYSAFPALLLITYSHKTKIQKHEGKGREITAAVTLYEKTGQTKLAYFPEFYDHTSFLGTAENGASITPIPQVRESAILL
jgi:hypothetical protein